MAELQKKLGGSGGSGGGGVSGGGSLLPSFPRSFFVNK